MVGGVVADVDCFGGVAGVLMCCGTSDAEGGVASCVSNGVRGSGESAKGKGGIYVPVMMTTLPFTRSPGAMSATCRIPGRPSNSASAGIPSTNCLLRACSLAFAAAPAML